ncbi:MAG: hypothetical protein NT175_00010 [Bacteroidetes bacterium]|nr:hypothetical protein [Bacteroidota bacterium]
MLVILLTGLKRNQKKHQKRKSNMLETYERIFYRKTKIMEVNMKTIRDAKTFDELLDIKYGKIGTPSGTSRSLSR